MSNPIAKAKFCPLKPTASAPLPKHTRRFALRDADFKARDDSYVNASHIERADLHEHLMNTNAMYRVFHYLSVIFGAHDERTPKPYRGGLLRLMGR